MIFKNLIHGKLNKQYQLTWCLLWRDNDEERVMHSKSDNIDYMIELLLPRCQIAL